MQEKKRKAVRGSWRKISRVLVEYGSKARIASRLTIYSVREAVDTLFITPATE
jgi:hypothetical protein